ncbi:MAG: complex I subunit 1 family protein [Ignisphaera sp.]
MNEMILILISIMIFPGLLFLAALSFLTQYFVRKLSARYQRRMGPSYVGPLGILQPFYDFWKLLRSKEIVKNRYSLVGAAEISLLIGISFIVASVVLLPLSLYNIASDFDILIFFYMTSVMPLFMMVIASLSMPGPYTSMGISRLLSLATLSEPTYFASLIIPIYLTTKQSRAFMSISSAYTNVLRIWLDPRGVVIMVLCLIAYIVAVQAKSMYQPFNIPEAEQEIIAGYETEFSGPLLALMNLLHDMDLTISLITGVYVLLGGPLPYSHTSLQGILMIIIKYLLLLVVVTLIKNIMGRYRIEQGLAQILKYGLIPSIMASILTFLF